MEQRIWGRGEVWWEIDKSKTEDSRLGLIIPGLRSQMEVITST